MIEDPLIAIVIVEVTIMKAMQVTLDDELHRQAKSLASRQGITLGEFVRRAVARAVEENAIGSTEGTTEGNVQ